MPDMKGSEWHLLRYMGRHRQELDSAVQAAVGCQASVKWLDFGYGAAKREDRELRGIGFLPSDVQASLSSAWKAFWPSTGNAQNWDAIAVLDQPSGPEYVLIEAKANTDEVISSCKAQSSKSKALISQSLAGVKQALEVPVNHDWLAAYYQYANRLAMLHFLNTHGVPARLVYIYFCGDKSRKSAICPADPQEWQPILQLQEEALGLPAKHGLSDRVHKLFIDLR